MDNHNIKTVFIKYIHPLDTKVVQKMIEHTQIDKYVKKLNSLAFTKLFIYAQLKNLPNLRRISEQVARKKTLQRIIGLKSISKSQLSRKQSQIPPEIFQAIFQHLVQQLHRFIGSSKASKELGRLHLIDSSTISMCLSQYRWADFRETKAGVKLHTSITFCDGKIYPNDVRITPAKPADITQLDALIAKEKDVLHVFDRGYFDFDKFEHYCEHDILFATRIKSNTVVHVIEELPVTPASPITREAIITIGRMKHPLHLVETTDTKGNEISIVCNDGRKSGEEISQIYRTRWQIELFFKWVKQHLVLKKMYGKSMNSVFNQLYLAMITFCLTLLLKHSLGYRGSLLELFDWIGDVWPENFNRCAKDLLKETKRTSNGRQKTRHHQLFEEILAQYEAGHGVD